MRTALFLVLVLTACSGGGRRSASTSSTSTTTTSSSSSSAADMLVALSSVETMHHGMGSSSHPGPNANHSRTTTLELNLDGKHHRLRIEGWADVPQQASAVMNRVNQASTGCTTK
jgi:hypothetical protein